jgi:sulfite reductase alpha subunit-like flavoprotein
MLDNDYDDWLAQLWQPLEAELKRQNDEGELPEVNVNVNEPARPAPEAVATPAPTEVKTAGTVKVNKLLHPPTSLYYCTHIEFDIPGMKYSAGDHLGVRPTNLENNVWEVAARLNIDLATTASMTNGCETLCLDAYTMLLRHCDLTGPLQRSFLRELLPHAGNPQPIEELVSAPSHASAGLWNFMDIVRLAKLSMSADRLFELLLAFSPMRPRYYSISSSPLAHQTVSLTVKHDLKRRWDAILHHGSHSPVPVFRFVYSLKVCAAR